MSINASINTVICSYMNTASARGREKLAHAQRPPKENRCREDKQNAEKKHS